MKWDDIPSHARDALVERGYNDYKVADMSPKWVFREYCTWHGLLGWGEDLYDLAIALHKKEKP